MAEAITQEVPQQPAAPAPQPAQAELDMSDEAIMGRAMAATPPPLRDPQTGRFLPQQQAQAVANAEPAQPAAAEQPAEPEAETPAEAETAEGVKWDEVKDVKIKVPMKDGDKVWEEELTIGQLRDGRMMHADYTKKTQEVAEREKQAQVHAQQAVEKERAQYLEVLGTLQQTLQAVATPELANVDWRKLAAENPGEYVRLQNRAQEFNAALHQVAAETKKVQEQQSREAKAKLDQAVSESRTKLKEAIPQWNDDLYEALLKRSTDTYGFSRDEMAPIWDHRIMRVLHDAHQWRATQEGKPLAEKKVLNVPAVLRPGNAKPKVDPKTQELQRTRERLAANGNDIDAAAALMGNFLK